MFFVCFFLFVFCEFSFSLLLLFCVVVFNSNNFSFQPVPHDWCTKGRGMYYPACGMMHIK